MHLMIKIDQTHPQTMVKQPFQISVASLCQPLWPTAPGEAPCCQLSFREMLKQLGAQQLSAKVRGELGNGRDLAASHSP